MPLANVPVAVIGPKQREDGTLLRLIFEMIAFDGACFVQRTTFVKENAPAIDDRGQRQAFPNPLGDEAGLFDQLSGFLLALVLAKLLFMPGAAIAAPASPAS